MAALQVLTTADRVKWEEALAAIPRKEIVHYPQYTRVYERYGDGKGECVVFESDNGILLYPFLRRAIVGTPGLTDIITPYGYGGAIYQAWPGQSSDALIADFRKAFLAYARETNTISEFVRYHPYLANHEPFVGQMDEVNLHCVNAITDLSIGAQALFQQYRRSYQQSIRVAQKFGLKVAQIPAPEFITPFFKLYSASMLRKHQAGYLKFRREFLVVLADELKENLKCFAVDRDGELIAMALFLHNRNYLDYFLAASNPEMLPLHPNHLLLHEVALWALDNDAEWFHLGGGHKSIQFFKHGFANQSRDYYIGKHIFDHISYARLSSEHWERHGREWTPSEPYFPGYRAEFTEDS